MTETEIPTMADRVAELGITLTVKDGPTFTTAPDGWQHNAYRITLRRRPTLDPNVAQSITLPWMQGRGLHGAPGADEVLDSIVSDVTMYEDAHDFDGYVSEYGVVKDDPEQVKAARKTWAALGRLAPKVRAFLGDDFDAVAYDTERL